EDRQVLWAEVRGTLDRLVLVDVVEDLADLLRAIAELAEGRRDGLVDDLEEALTDELLVLDEGDVRLDAGRVAIHHEGDRAGGGEDGDLGVAVAVGLAERELLVVDGAGRGDHVLRDGLVGRDQVGGIAVLVDDPQERLAGALGRRETATRGWGCELR